jgi:hypothetical protein
MSEITIGFRKEFISVKPPLNELENFYFQISAYKIFCNYCQHHPGAALVPSLLRRG